MKQLKFIFPILIFLALPWVINSCCKSSGYGTVSSRYGFSFAFSDNHYLVLKIELIGANKTIEREMQISSDYDYNYYSGYSTITYDTFYTFPKIELNAADTVSGFRIFYIKDNIPDSIWNGVVTLGYTPKPQIVEDHCHRDLVMTYDNLKVSNTTFTATEINGTRVQITR